MAMGSSASRLANAYMSITHDEEIRRKLTNDWNREIKLDSGLIPLYRFKGEATTHRHRGYVQVSKGLQNFCTGSTYEGNYDSVGFAGLGEFIYPHGVKYEGYFKGGQFHGEGTITYPMGQQIDGTWKNGKLIDYVFKFADGLQHSTPWKYCQQPDRRFQSEVLDGLNAAGEEYLTNSQPTKPLNDGCYDTVDGFFDPHTKCVYKDEYTFERKGNRIYRRHRNPSIIRVCTKTEEDFIRANYRKAADENVGYRPDLYEYWTCGCQEEMRKIEEYERFNTDTTESYSSYMRTKGTITPNTSTESTT